MGCMLSCRSTPTFHGVRVVHINGYVENYPGPVTVSEVTGKHPKLACFSPSQLLSFAPRPLAPDVSLELGSLYFLLPHTVFRSDTSPVDLAKLVTRLTAVARNDGGPPTVAASKEKLAAVHGRVMRSPAGQHISDSGQLAVESDVGGRCGYAGGGIGGKMQSLTPRSWKPMLDTIEERSIGRSTRSLSSRGSSC